MYIRQVFVWERFYYCIYSCNTDYVYYGTHVLFPLYFERKDDKQDRVKEVGHAPYLSDTPLVRILCWVVLYRGFENLRLQERKRKEKCQVGLRPVLSENYSVWSSCLWPLVPFPLLQRGHTSVSKQDERVPTWADLAGNLTGMF